MRSVAAEHLIPQRQRRVTASMELRDRGFVAAAQPDS